MSVLQKHYRNCLLSAIMVSLAWLMVQPVMGDVQNSRVDAVPNPLRFGRDSWNPASTPALAEMQKASQEQREPCKAAPPQAAVPPVAATPMAMTPIPPQPAIPEPQPIASRQAALQPMVAQSIAAEKPAPTPAAPCPSMPVQLIAMQQVEQRIPEPAPMPAPQADSDSSSSGASMPYAPVLAENENATLTGVQPELWMSCQSNCRCGVACPCDGDPSTDRRWAHKDVRMIPWQMFAQGEYVGPARLAHVPQYRLRVDDMVRMIYGLTGEPSSRPYSLAVGDIIQIESNGDPKINRSVTIQPDGMVTVRYLGQIRAAGFSIEELRTDLESRYKHQVKDPAISVTPVKLNSRVEELRQAVDQRYGPGGQGVFVRVTPAGTVQLPSIGSIPVQGLTLDEVKREIEARYARRFHGVEVTPVLDQRAPRYLFVLGEVKNPGRYELQGPTTAMQAIAMAGGWNVGAELRQIVVFRRDECWRLMATQLHLRSAVRGTHPCPADEIWLRDSDILLIPKSRLLEADDMIQLLFTRGLYGVAPFNMAVSWTNISAL